MKTMKKAVSLLLCLILLAGTAAAGGEGFADALASLIDAISVRAEAESVNDLTYEINSGEVTIIGCDINTSGELIIPGTLEGYPTTAVGDNAFRSCNKLTKVTVPHGVTSIGDEAFAFCAGLSQIDLPDTLKTIGLGAFGMTALVNVTIPDSVTIIGSGAFQNCNSLSNITIGNSVENIGEMAFYVTGITEITIPESVIMIGNGVFAGCNRLENITVSNSNTVYHSYNNCIIHTETKTIIAGCNNSIIPNDDFVTGIAAKAFYQCERITDLIIPDNITFIGDSAFVGCGLTSLTVGKGVTTIVGNAFGSGLETINVKDGNPRYCSTNNCLVDTENRELITGCKNSVIPDDGSVTMIGMNAFEDCSFTSVIIPQSVKGLSIGAFRQCWWLESVTFSEGLEVIGESAFEYCSSLKSINIPASVTEIFCNAFAGCWDVETISVEQSNSEYHSSGNCIIDTDRKALVTGCKNSLIPDDGSVLSIGICSFLECRTLKRITIPDGVTTIESDSFSVQDAGLESIVIPSSMANIDARAFCSCNNLTDVYYTGTQEQWNVITIGEENDCLLNANIHYNYIDEPDPLDVLTYEIVDGSVRILRCDFTACGRLIIPASIEGYPVTAIGDGAFSGCEKLISITIPDSVTGIGDGAFEGCTGLTDIYYQGTPEQWAAVQIGENNAVLSELNIHFVFYNLGEETYSFVNYKNRDYGCRHLYSGGHCFGMAVTSSGYYLGILDKAEIGGENKSIHSLGNTAEVRNPICHYLKIQGSVGPEGTKGAEREAIVAGGSIDLTGNKNTRSDWNACVNYVKDHKFDYKGTLNVGMWYAAGGGHAVNFLYYKEVGSQERIYVYDNNYPDREMYYYMGADGYIHEKSDSGSSPGDLIKGMDLMDVATYFEYADAYSSLGNVIYAKKSEIAVENAERSDMKSEDYNYVIYRFSGDEKVVVITPLVDNAEFEYMGVTYSFNDIDEDTYGVIDVISDPEDETERTGFKIENAPPRVQIGNFVAERTEDYRTTMTFKAEITDPNDDVAVHWFINGSDEGTGETFTVENAKADYTVQAKFINKTGEVVHESETETVKIKHGFFDMLIWFFKHLFNPGAYIKEQ